MLLELTTRMKLGRRGARAELSILDIVHKPLHSLERVNEFCRRMRLKWHFRHESEHLNEVPVFNPKSKWQPPQGHPCLEVFLSQVENESKY